VDIRSGEMAKFRDVLFNIIPILIKALALLNRIKDSVIRGCIGTCARCPLPPVSVRGNVIIHKMVSEEICS
jgi:hypothetical protein